MSIHQRRDIQNDGSFKDLFSFALLMGGKGKRLGGIDKAGLIWKEHTLAARLSACGLEVAREILWISPHSPVEHYKVDPSIIPFISIYEDHPDVKGSLAGILSALKSARSEWVWIISCDLPLLSSSILRPLSSDLFSLWKNPVSEFSKTLPKLWAYQTENHFHPLCALWHHSLYSEVLELSQNHTPLFSLKNKPFTSVIPLENERPLFNLNTSDDLKTLSHIAISSNLGMLTEKTRVNGETQP